MENQIDKAENQQESKPVIREKSSVKIKIWNIASFLLFAAGIVFLIIFRNHTYYDYPVVHYKDVIVAGSIAVILISAWCFFSFPIKVSAAKFVFLIIAGIMFIAGWYIYFRYIPKYLLADECAIVQADPKYASATVEPRYNRMYDENGRLYASNSVNYKIEDNPFWESGDILNVIKDGKVIALIAFDNVTGKYYVFYEPKDEYADERPKPPSL